MINFTPIDRMKERLQSTIVDSDLAYYYDLLLLGEIVTKSITLFLVSVIDEDSERTKYRHEHFIVRANAIGDFSKTIDEILTGLSSGLISPLIRELELRELTQRVSDGEWQYQALKLLIECLDEFNIKHDPLPVKFSLKNWFHLFTELRNKTKGHGATKAQPCTNACPKLYQSIQLIIDNSNVFKRPWAYLHRNLSGKYRISYISNCNQEFDYLKRETTHHFENGIYCFVGTPKKINLMYSNSELSDFYFPNGNLRNDIFETISYVSDERYSQNAKDYLTPATPLPSSETEGLPQLDVVGNCFTNIPMQIDGYVSRVQLEEELSNILIESERFPVVTLMGRGGIGKTSLAINVIRNITQTNRFDLIVWFSARDVDLLIQGPKHVKTKVINQIDISKYYCHLLYPQKTIKDEVSFFSGELNKNSFGKTLYIFDNFETITNPIEVYEWINTCIRNPNKILITSRTSRSFKADYPIEVRGMTEVECLDLINSFSMKLGINNIISQSYIDELISESDGHPYIIKVLLGEVAKTGKAGNVKRIVAENEKVLSALFKRTFNTMSPAAKRVFLTLCSWNSSIPQIALETVLWRPENEKMDVQGAIDELQKSSFIELINENVDTFINVPLAALIYGKSELEVYPEKLKIFEDRKLLMEFGAITSDGVNKGIASRIERKFAEVARRINSLDELKNELPSLQYIASRHYKAWDYLTDIYEEYSDYDNAKYSLRELLKESLSDEEKAKYWLRLANICSLTKDWEGESHALFELASIPRIDYETISDCANRINNYFRYHPEEKQVEYKKILLQKIISVMENRIQEASSTDYSRLAWLLINSNRNDKAQEYIDKGLSNDLTNIHCIRLKEKLSTEIDLFKK